MRNIDGVGRDRVRNGFIKSEPRIDHAAKRLPPITCRICRNANRTARASGFLSRSLTALTPDPKVRKAADAERQRSGNEIM